MGIIDLWVPILVASIIVFVASALVWTVLPWHKSDFSRTSDEEAVRKALEGTSPGGQYMVPYCIDPAELKDEAVAKKFEDGPQAYITVIPNGLPKMAPKMALSFLYNVLVSVICAYFVTRTRSLEASYLEVFRIAGSAAFIAYGVAYIQESVWFGRPWSMTLKSLFDALLYGLLTGGVFGWLYG